MGSTLKNDKGQYNHFFRNGYSISQAKKIFEYAFGEFFVKADINESKTGLNVFLKKRLTLKEKGENDEIVDKTYKLEDAVDLKYFIDHFESKPEDPKWKFLFVE